MARMTLGQTGLLTKVRHAFIAGGAAGAHTLTGITTDDRLVQVLAMVLTLGEAAPNTISWAASDLTSEFSISAADTIDNTGGTATTDGFLLVAYYDDDWGRDTASERIS